MRIKICGITTEADAALAVNAGADAIGLNFYPRSPRYVTEAQAFNIIRKLPPFVEPVALFVNETWDQILPVASRLGVRTIQWHGDQPELPPPGPYHYLPAFPIKDESSLERIEKYLTRCRAVNLLPAGLLVDGHLPGSYGGTGKVLPWQLLSEFRCEVPLILAGGLTPENVAEAVQIVRPYGVDVASGVESSPGRKDPDKVRRFIEQAISASGGR